MSNTPTNVATNPITVQQYLECPPRMYAEANPAPSPSPALIELNRGLLKEYGLSTDWFYSEEGLAVLAGNHDSEQATTLAMAYGGHQFGQWVPLLGDGRAHMLGQLTTGGGRLIDVQLKGSGRTPYSRGGDGRATLGSVLREYIVSEAMAGLGIPTTRSLAVVTTGEPVRREKYLPGAVLVRTAESHLRVGSFQYASSTLNLDELRTFADFAIAQQATELNDGPGKYTAFLESVIEQQAALIARWMLVGFIHGVMNTDNMSIASETIDYGPCAFMDEFNPQKVFSSIDRHGRYAWDQQPSIGLWNLTQLAHSLAPLIDSSSEKAAAIIEQSLGKFVPAIQIAFHEDVSRKFGVRCDIETLAPFIQSTFKVMEANTIDFTVFFDYLTKVAGGDSTTLLLSVFEDKKSGTEWIEQWEALRKTCSIETEDMRRANPALIARNHQVEAAILAAETNNDFAPFRSLCVALASPFEVDAVHEALQVPPKPEELVTQTFCGT